MLCSNPHSTNKKTGQKHAIIFPIVLSAQNAIHTAIHTSKLHKMPLIVSCKNPQDTFVSAVLFNVEDIESVDNTPAQYSSRVIISAPAKLAM